MPTTNAERGSLRVQAWLHSALWPLHEVLHRGAVHLEAGDITWRHATGRLDGIRDALGALGAAGRANLADLLEAEGESLRAPIERHELAVSRLTAAAAEAQTVLARAIRDVAGRGRGRFGDGDISGLAQVLINGTFEHEVTSGALLDAVHDHLARLRDARPHMLDAARVEAADAIRALLDAVDALRRALCDRYDLPPAPIIIPHTGTH